MNWIQNLEMRLNKHIIYNSRSIEDITIKMIYQTQNASDVQDPTDFLDTPDTIVLKHHLDTPNIISQNELLSLILKHQHYKDKKYPIFKLLKYNPSFKPELIEDFLNDDYDMDYGNIQDVITDITFNDSIDLVYDLNTIIIVFKHAKQTNSKTRVNRSHHEYSKQKQTRRKI